MENTAKKIIMVFISLIFLFSTINYVNAGTVETWCNNGATCTESNTENNNIKINCYSSVYSWSSTYTASGCSVTNSCRAVSGGTNQGHVQIFPHNNYCGGDPCPGKQKTASLTVTCKSDGGVPPPPPPPPPATNPYCGDNKCNSGETCASRGTNQDYGLCYADCGSCKPTLSYWCERNCLNDRNCDIYIPYRQDCGEGWNIPNGRMCCNKDIPAGEQCGTCAGTAVCGDGRVTNPETCDDSNKITESCSYGQYSCTVCNSNCQSIQGIATRCGDGKVDPVNGEQCDDSNRNNGDGCNSNCWTETGYNCNGQPSVCSRGIDTCFDGIDNNGNGIIDENCGGCADLDNDGDVDYDDISILDKCVPASTSPSGACNTIIFSKVDWNDDRILQTESNPAALRSDLNKDGKVDFDDLMILSENYRRESSIGDINGDGFVDNIDMDLFKEDFSKVVMGHDLKCFSQQWDKAQRGERIPRCGEQSCTDKKMYTGGTLTDEYKCYSSIYCPSGSICSWGKEGRIDPTTFVFKTTPGVCCPVNTYWDGSSCIRKKAEPCSCPYVITQAEFWKDKNCLNINSQLACLKTTLFSRENEQLTLDIKKR